MKNKNKKWKRYNGENNSWEDRSAQLVLYTSFAINLRNSFSLETYKGGENNLIACQNDNRSILNTQFMVEETGLSRKSC